MKATIIALSAAALIAAAPAVPAQGVRTPDLHHKLAKKHHVTGYARPRAIQARDAKAGAFGDAPGQAHGYIDRDLEMSGRQAGGGGSGM